MAGYEPEKRILKKIKIVSVLGARPQFIKAAPVSALIRFKYRKKIREILVHTGQHYDRNMSDVFFRQMRIPNPKYNLGVGGGEHGAMTGRMMEKIENVLQKEKPDWVMVYGDTNSTLAGALAASKMQIPVAHVEAGLRSFNMKMPEEINRILTDHVSQLLFCPTKTAVKNLKKEGITQGVSLSGDVMMDAANFYRLKAKKIKLNRWCLQEKSYAFVTIHRQENTDNLSNLKEILRALIKISQKGMVVFAIHPRTRKVIEKNPILKKLLQLNVKQKNHWNLQKNKKIKKKTGIMFLEPLGYMETQRLLMGAKVTLTDSGGLQKEAFFHQVPCITLRNETEWLETKKSGLNTLAGSNYKKILSAYKAVKNKVPPKIKLQHATDKIIKALISKI